MSYDILFEPIQIGTLELKNRIALAPMNMGYTGPLGYPSLQSLAYYATRARGGFGLIITEATMINPHSWWGGEAMNPARLTDYRYYRFWSEIVQTVQSYNGCKICIARCPAQIMGLINGKAAYLQMLRLSRSLNEEERSVTADELFQASREELEERL